eukprot:2586385-Prymnesium_polylepis.1
MLVFGLVEPVAPGVVYTHAPARRAVDAPPPPPSHAARKRQADARLRRAVRTAWADPALARGDCTKVAPNPTHARQKSDTTASLPGCSTLRRRVPRGTCWRALPSALCEGAGGVHARRRAIRRAAKAPAGVQLAAPEDGPHRDDRTLCTQGAQVVGREAWARYAQCRARGAHTDTCMSAGPRTRRAHAGGLSRGEVRAAGACVCGADHAPRHYH